MKFPEQKYWLQTIRKEPTLTKWYFHWLSSLNGRRSPLSDELPWATYGAIDWLIHRLTKKMIVFEWGSGGSTLFFAKRVKQVITVEHDPIWYQEVRQTIEKKGYKNVFLRLVEPVQSSELDEWNTSTGTMYTGLSFDQYIQTIDAYSDGFFDVVVVDGRARPGCIKHAIPKIKNQGYLILDNSERLEYQAGCDLIKGWSNVQIMGPGPYNAIPWETRIWQKGSR